ncbi:MAG: ABC transporter ATP-binding protein [Candidatus Levyibacteriota bacterium]
MIEIKNIVKKFRSGDAEIVVLKNLSFTVPTGQFLAITGKSGSGKSTTLYQVSLLDRPNEGEIIIDGENVTRLTDAQQVTYRRNNFGFIFQDYALLPSLTAIENVILPMLMQDIDKHIALEKGAEALRRVGLGDKLDSLSSQLSGGQQQRVSIARSIVHAPAILFADEPTANLDTESSAIVLDIFLKLNKNGQTIIMVTHELDYAKIADRIIELRDGAIISDTMEKKSRSMRSRSRS